MAKSILVTEETIGIAVPLTLSERKVNGNRITLRLQGKSGREFFKDAQPYPRAVTAVLTTCVRQHGGAVTLRL
ncbi:MAG: hypothetical protein KGJ90_03260 [Patescibacteria group bacterium]|nr:hypothetical protein [Patescibacteria group bacterium]